MKTPDKLPLPVRAWTARKTLDHLNARVDERLLASGPLGPGLVFVKKWLEVIRIDCTVIKEKHFQDKDRYGLVFITRKWQVEGNEMENTFAIPQPDRWEWGTLERGLVQQIYGGIRTVDILIHDIVQSCNSELQLLTDSNRHRTQDVRLITDDERRERVDFIKSVTADYWYSGPWKPGRYPQCSAQDEATRQLHRDIANARGKVLTRKESEREKEVNT